MPGADHPDALPAGSLLHWYELNSVLGQSGSGITYLGFDLNLEQAVAIKEYLPRDLAIRHGDEGIGPRTPDLGRAYRWGLARFEAEARILARLDHPNLVRVHSVFEMNGTAYMVMRREEGRDLKDWLAGGARLDADAVRELLVRVASGLARVHGAGFVHHDIKPANIYIHEDGSPVLLGFGSAREPTTDASAAPTRAASPGYAPFEQYVGLEGSQGPWTDVYSLAATAYRALTGAAPVSALERVEQLRGSGTDPYVPLARGDGGAGRVLYRAIDDALALRAADRPQSLYAWLGTLAPEARIADPPRPIAARAPVGGRPRSSTSTRPPALPGWHRHARRAAIAAGAAIPFGLGLVAVDHWPSLLRSAPVEIAVTAPARVAAPAPVSGSDRGAPGAGANDAPSDPNHRVPASDREDPVARQGLGRLPEADAEGAARLAVAGGREADAR